MLYCPWVLVAMETRLHVFTLKYLLFLTANFKLRTRCVNALYFSHGAL